MPRPALRRDIQGLRALAVLAVVLDHALGWPRGGFAGVDVFFVISGFLVTGMLLRELRSSGRVSLGDFFARRLRRLAAASLVVLVVVVAAGFVAFSRTRAEQTLGDAVSALLLASNWRFAADGTDYFRAGDAVSPLQHFWSLSVEEQFSLAWPVVLVVLLMCVPSALRRRFAAVVAGVAALILVAGSATWAVAATTASPEAAYFSTIARVWELGVGAVLAASAPALRRLSAFLRGAAGWIGLAGVIASFVLVDPELPFPVPGAVLPVAAAALVIAGGIGGDPRHPHLFPLTNPLAVGVGNISYSLYLWHFPVIVFAAALLPPGATTTAIVLGGIVVLSLASYFGIEQPFRLAPWRRSGDVAPAPPPEPHPAPRPEPVSLPRPAAQLSRPDGWVPGSRYYPGARRPSAPVLSATAASEPAAPEPPAHVPEPAAPRRFVSAPADPDPVADPDRAADAPRPWASWRRRFAAQMGLSATAVALGAGAIVVVLFATYGAPTLGPTAAPEPAAVAGASADDLQSQLAAAVTAASWPELHPSLDDVMARSSSDNPAHDCFAPGIALDAARCMWGSPDAPRHLLLVGDSSAMAYAPTFKRLAEDSGGALRVTTAGMYGCRFTDVLVRNADPAVMAGCAQRKHDVRALAEADPADLVVVSNAYTLGQTVDGRDLDAADLQRAAHAEVAAYAPAGGSVYLAPPPHGADLSRCYSPLGSPGACTAAIDDTWYEMQNAAEAEAATSGDHALSALEFSCWEGVCPAFADGLPIRYDQNHLTVAYAEHIAPSVQSSLAALGLL